MERNLEALEFLENNKAGVLATSVNGIPHASTVYYVCDGGFNIYFVTQVSSMKYTSIQENPAVAFTVFNSNVPQQVQIEGVAEEIKLDENFDQDIVGMFIKAHSYYYPAPITKLDSDGIAFMKISPQWIRWADFVFAPDGTNKVFTEIPVIVQGV